jgi:NAD(P)H-flavin reductase
MKSASAVISSIIGREVAPTGGDPAVKRELGADVFVGENGVQYGLWAHYLALGAGLMCVVMGIFAVRWDTAGTYHCKILGDSISPNFLFTGTTCPTVYTHNGVSRNICCDPASESDLRGYPEIGYYYIFYGLFTLLYEDTYYGFGWWFPNHTFLYEYRISFIGIIHLIIGACGLYNYATALPGAFLVTTGAVYSYAAYRRECGDGGRRVKKRAAEKAAQVRADTDEAEAGVLRYITETFDWLTSFNPVTFCRRIYNEDKLSSYVWVFLFVGLNIALFIYTLNVWYEAIYDVEDKLKDGTLNVTCDSLLCHVYRKAVRYGPVSRYAPWAKACGNCLNLNCSLILLPITRMLLRKLNNWGESFSAAQQNSDVMGKFFARPLTRYIPLGKNIEFHKLCAVAIFFFSWGHMIFHFLNLQVANNTTMRLFRVWGWNGSDYFTGAIATYAMFIIYTAAPDIVRYTKFEIFFNTHHFFTIFFLALFLHGPVFFYWACIPVLLYILERVMQMTRGWVPFYLVKVEWISPVMAIYFKPQLKETFQFKEGQYLYMNCPYISKSEWHPFTISSAYDDLTNGPRIHLETGEDVVEVPRPKNLPPKAKWNKYCLASQDYTTMDPADYLDKSETAYGDFVSVHVKVHGLNEPYARTWTRKLKEYFEMLSPGGKFPFYFSQRDARGDLQVGRMNGPDGQQIIRIDGPHSAPSEHYTNYGTVMLIGAGIGLTPCASILCALTKYRWKKNYNPELVHFYWVVRQAELDSFQWLIHMLTDLSFELKKSKQYGQIDKSYYCEIHIYVTGAEKDAIPVAALHRPKRVFHQSACKPNFTADELYAMVLNPTVSSKGQVQRMKDARPQNRLQDIWVWNGRPHWDDIFKDMKDQRQHSDIGVCFCGAPVIGADLRTMCEKYSDVSEQCLFSLHKENF